MNQPSPITLINSSDRFEGSVIRRFTSAGKLTLGVRIAVIGAEFRHLPLIPREFNEERLSKEIEAAEAHKADKKRDWHACNEDYYRTLLIARLGLRVAIKRLDIENRKNPMVDHLLIALHEGNRVIRSRLHRCQQRTSSGRIHDFKKAYRHLTRGIQKVLALPILPSRSLNKRSGYSYGRVHRQLYPF